MLECCPVCAVPDGSGGFCEALRSGFPCCLAADDDSGGSSTAFPGIGQKAGESAAAKMSNEECLACHSDATLTKDENGKQVSLHVDDAKFKASIHSIFGCTDCHADIKAFPHDPTPVKPDCATCHADQQAAYDHGIHAKAAAAGNTNVAKCQDCHGSVHEILPASDPKSKVAHTNIPADLRRLPRSEICDGVRRRECRGLHLLPAERARQSSRRRIGESCRLHRLPRRARHPERRRSEVADQQVQRADNLRQVPRRCQGGIHAEHSRHGDRARQLAGAGVHRLPRHSHHQGAQRSELCGGCSQRAEHLRVVPRRREALEGIRRRRQPRLFVPGELSRHGVRRSDRTPSPTAPVATACTTFCRPAIRGRRSITPTSRRPAASAIRARTRSSSRRKVHLDGTSKADVGSQDHRA